LDLSFEQKNLVRNSITPNSALNIRASLNFLNSLLLPAIALLLANFDEVLKLFQVK